MTVARKTPALDALGRWVAGLGARYEVVLDAPDAEQAKLAWLAAGQRDLLKITPQLERAVASAVAADARRLITSGGNLRTGATLRAVGDVIKAAVLGRITAQGGDVTLAALSPAYRAFKARAGRDPRIAVATGHLLRALRAATFSLRRSRG